MAAAEESFAQAENLFPGPSATRQLPRRSSMRGDPEDYTRTSETQPRTKDGYNEHSKELKSVQFKNQDEFERRRAVRGLSRHRTTPWNGKLVFSLGTIWILKKHERLSKADISIDGGGIRGLTALLLLEELMKEIEREERRMDQHSKSSADSPYLRNVQKDAWKSEYLPCHYFDFIGGTSTGG